MLIGGYQACSLVDFPGRVAAVVFTQGCNFRCPYCHNGGLLPARSATAVPAEEALARIAVRRRQLDGVVVTGGEPTLHGDLAGFLRAVRGLGLLVKLDTNGSRPAVLRGLLAAGLVDFVAMDLKAPWEKYASLAGVPVEVREVCESVRWIAESGVAHEFRTTWPRGLLSADDIAEIRRSVPAGSPYRVQKCRADRALRPELCAEGVSGQARGWKQDR